MIGNATPKELSNPMREKKVWSGFYRDISWEINNWKWDLGAIKENWTFYLYLPLEAFPKELHKKIWLRGKRDKLTGRHVMYDYYKSSLISDLEWHGGCTWYSKASGFDGEKKVVMVGCDFQHLWWDEYQYYSVECVKREVEKCIDSLHGRVPNMKKRCWYNGEWFEPSEGQEIDGRWTSNKGIEQQKKYEEERIASNLKVSALQSSEVGKP